MPVRSQVVVLGAGFGGLELATDLSGAFGDEIDVLLIDKSDSFVIGFSKLDVMFGRQMPADVRCYYCEVAKPGIRFVQTTVRSIDPAFRGAVTKAILAQLRRGPEPEAYKGAGACYVEFGHARVGRVEVDPFSGPKHVANFQEPSEELLANRVHFKSSRIEQWFGQSPASGN